MPTEATVITPNAIRADHPSSRTAQLVGTRLPVASRTSASAPHAAAANDTVSMTDDSRTTTGLGSTGLGVGANCQMTSHSVVSAPRTIAIMSALRSPYRAVSSA